jgi:chromosome segregation ATPase
MENEPQVIPPVDPEIPPVEPTPNPDPKPQTPPVSDTDLIKNPAVRSLVEAARKQEKDKLYKTMDAKDEQIKTLAGRIEELEKQLSEKESVNMDEVKELKETINLMQQQQADLLKALSDQKEEAEREKAEQAEARRKAELKAYREAKLREAGDELVVELVKGDTEEEIDQSIESAKQKYLEIVAKVEGARKPESRANNTPRVTNPSSNPTQAMTVDQIRNMSREDFAKNREAILKAAKDGMIK